MLCLSEEHLDLFEAASSVLDVEWIFGLRLLAGLSALRSR